MTTSHTTDLNLSSKDIAGLASAGALAGFLTALGYDTGSRKPLTPEAIGLAGDSAAAIKRMELLSEDGDGFLRVLFVELRSLTARSRNDLARALGKSNVDHLLVLTSDFSTIEFVLLDKRRRESRGPGGGQRIQIVPLTLAVDRKSPSTRDLRTIRRFTWTTRDGLEQFDKLRSVFEAAAFSEDYFCNRALFADHYLLTRLREDPPGPITPRSRFSRSKSSCATHARVGATRARSRSATNSSSRCSSCWVSRPSRTSRPTTRKPRPTTCWPTPPASRSRPRSSTPGTVGLMGPTITTISTRLTKTPAPRSSRRSRKGSPSGSSSPTGDSGDCTVGTLTLAQRTSTRSTCPKP